MYPAVTCVEGGRPHIVFDNSYRPVVKIAVLCDERGLFTVAHLLFPSDEPSLREFVSFCRRKFLIYKISLFEESSWLGSPRKSSTQD